MRKLFPGYYMPSAEEIDQQWKEGLFVFDTSVLLDLYSYPEQAREDFLKTLEDLAERTWIPYQVMSEFHRNRHKRISSANRAVLDLRNHIKKSAATTAQNLNSIQFEKRNTGINDIKTRVENYEKASQNLIDALDIACSRLPTSGLNDEIALRLAKIYENRVGEAPKNQEEMTTLLSNAEERYRDEIPPGFADAANKNGVVIHGGIKYENKFGDLVVWRQMLCHVQNIKAKRIIFVTSERKSDFWTKDETGKILGPLPELIGEFIRLTGADFFWLYSAVDFLELTEKQKGNQISTDTIEEVREVSLQVEEQESENQNFSEPDIGTSKLNVSELALSKAIAAARAAVNANFKLRERNADPLLLAYIRSVEPGKPVSRVDGGWATEENYYEVLITSKINVNFISTHLSEMIEPLLYKKCVLMILVTESDWAALSSNSQQNLIMLIKNAARKNSVTVVIATHENFALSELYEISSSD